MTVFKRKSGRWGVKIYNPGTGRYDTIGTYDTRREAQAVEAETKQTTRLVPVTVADLSRRWVTDYADMKKWQQSTRVHNEERVRAFVAKHGDKRVTQITVVDALRWGNDHPAQVPALRAMFSFARFIGARTDNPFAELRLSSKPKRERTALTQEEIVALADAARRLHGQWHASLVTFAAWTGLRAGELFALRYRNVRAEEIVVDPLEGAYSRHGGLGSPKNGKGRIVPLLPEAKEALRLLPRRPGQEFVFINPRTAAPCAGRFPLVEHFTPSSYGYYWRQLRAGFGRPLVFHELRHTAATLLVDAGLDAWDVAKFLGHEDGGILVRKTYGHPAEEAARERIRQAFAKPVPLRVAAANAEAIHEEYGTAAS